MDGLIVMTSHVDVGHSGGSLPQLEQRIIESDDITKIGPNRQIAPVVFPLLPQLNGEKSPEKVVTPVIVIGHMFSNQVFH